MHILMAVCLVISVFCGICFLCATVIEIKDGKSYGLYFGEHHQLNTGDIEKIIFCAIASLLFLSISACIIILLFR